MYHSTPGMMLIQSTYVQESSKNNWKGGAGLIRGIVAHFVIVT